MHNQKYLSASMRAILVDWLVEVQENFELNHETLYLAVKLVDMYVAKKEIAKEILQLIGAVALFIASKFDVSLNCQLFVYCNIAQDKGNIQKTSFEYPHCTYFHEKVKEIYFLIKMCYLFVLHLMYLIGTYWNCLAKLISLITPKDIFDAKITNISSLLLYVLVKKCILICNKVIGWKSTAQIAIFL